MGGYPVDESVHGVDRGSLLLKRGVGQFTSDNGIVHVLKVDYPPYLLRGLIRPRGSHPPGLLMECGTHNNTVYNRHVTLRSNTPTLARGDCGAAKGRGYISGNVNRRNMRAVRGSKIIQGRLRPSASPQCTIVM